MAQLTASDLMAPAGPVESFLFPEEDSNQLPDRLNGYLANAYVDARVAAFPDATQNSMAKAYALWQVYTAVYTRLSAMPITVTVAEKGGHGYSAEQIRNFRDLANKYLADFNGMLIVEPSSPPTAFPGTVSVGTEYRW